MRNIIIAILAAQFFHLSAQESDWRCRLGFSYEISSNKNWGYDKPVIMKVYPNSPAEEAGVKQNDIIIKINDLRVSDITPDDVDSLLTAAIENTMTLTLCNFADSAREITITKECHSTLSLTESQLATAFAMYSVEDTHDRLFICPFVTSTTNEDVDFAKFRTFTFAVTEDESITAIETAINETLRTALTDKGLSVNSVNPDILVQTYYSFDKNPNFRKKSKETAEQMPVFRYDITRDKITRFPFYNSSTPESESEYLLQLGVRFIDRRIIPGRVLWECEANELMSAPYSVEEYAAIHIPLMLMQFPYIKYQRNAQFILTKKAYNYTGVNFNIYRINEVESIDFDSPAHEAGVFPGDIIERIDEKRMDHSSNEFTAAYRQFITNTLKFRDSETRFTDANGFPGCMFWDKLKYSNIAKAFDKKNYMTGFSYLYAFQPFINPLRSSLCTFDILRAGERIRIVVRPEFRSEKTIELN
jgi:membrane-associated protease RseP (regulator of RpoE activity)